MREPLKDKGRIKHILVHGYYTVNAEILWDVINNDIPKLRPILEKYIAEQDII